eukprot:TRINITY_DN1293_c0_g1_i2.p1 TRINITY_DN1293_c0_g1~~TRINITY_DN1293_c0_g1_i2.p1  ORF type:complete len:176 (-),score=47.14 TRINITY_DN1293_c0_g1_i2:837-1364(-)
MLVVPQIQIQAPSTPNLNQNPPISYLCCIPNEILEIVVNYLREKDVCHLTGTCTRFYSEIWSLRKELNLKSFRNLTPQDIIRILHKSGDRSGCNSQPDSDQVVINSRLQTLYLPRHINDEFVANLMISFVDDAAGLREDGVRIRHRLANLKRLHIEASSITNKVASKARSSQIAF